MKVSKLTLAQAQFERSPGQDGDIFAADLIDQSHGGPLTVGYGRYGPHESLTETIAVDDVMIVLQGRLSITTDEETFAAGPGDIVYMPKGRSVTIQSDEAGAVTAYVTYPHWRQAHA